MSQGRPRFRRYMVFEPCGYDGVPALDQCVASFDDSGEAIDYAIRHQQNVDLIWDRVADETVEVPEPVLHPQESDERKRSRRMLASLLKRADRLGIRVVADPRVPPNVFLLTNTLPWGLP